MQVIDNVVSILDKGFVRLIECTGSDELIVNAARTSYKWNKKSTDEQLIDYLVRNEHSSPIEFGEMIFHIKVPIFVARQMFRHRTASISEISARYTEVEEEYYIPEFFRGQNKINKQMSDGSLEEPTNSYLLDYYEHVCQKTFECYKELLKNGVSRELARMILPLSTYTQFYWKQDLRNLLHFVRLRKDYHAQYEIQQVANAIELFIKEKFPFVYKSFNKHVINSVRFSEDELPYVFDNLDINVMNDTIENANLSKNRKKELLEKIERVSKLKGENNDQ